MIRVLAVLAGMAIAAGIFAGWRMIEIGWRPTLGAIAGIGVAAMAWWVWLGWSTYLGKLRNLRRPSK